MKHHLYYFLILILIMITEPLYRERLFEYSLSYIKEIQTARTEFSTTFFVIVSKLGDGDLYLAIFLIIYACDKQARALSVMTFICSGSVIMTLTKIYYMEPRPYFVDDEINCLDKCSAEYGNPSGHSLFASYIFMLYREYMKDKPFSVFKALFFILSIVTIPLIGYSRIYVGAHTIN